jgi:hypothetical protein
MEIETFASHYEEQATVPAPADLLFDYLDDFEQLGAHMTRSSWMMAGSGRLLGALAGGAYARWCVRNMLQQALAHFESAADEVGLSADFRQPSGKAS